jgi:hypothetical protein
MANCRVYFDAVVDGDSLDAAAVLDQLTKVLETFGTVTVLAFNAAAVEAGVDAVDTIPAPSKETNAPPENS